MSSEHNSDICEVTSMQTYTQTSLRATSGS